MAAFRKQKFYQTWDERVFDRWCKYGIRDTPTNAYPDENGKVTLATSKHQECFTFMRPSWDAVSPDGSKILRRDLVPDLSLEHKVKYPLYRPEPVAAVSRLGELRPSVLYIFGGASAMSLPDARRVKMEVTGAGLGGSGGAKEGRVKEVVLDKIGHLVAMEAAEACAEAASQWLGQEVKRAESQRKEYLEWTKQRLSEKQTMSEEWKKMVGGPIARPGKSKI